MSKIKSHKKKVKVPLHQHKEPPVPAVQSDSPRPLNQDIPFVELIHGDIHLPEVANATSGMGFLSDSTMENPLQGFDLSTTLDRPGGKESVLSSIGMGCTYQGEVAFFPHYGESTAKKKKVPLNKTKTAVKNLSS